MYSKELEELIDAALADGVLTEKERAVLFKRAAAEGVDLDEFEVVVEGRLAKMKRQEDWLRPVPPVQAPVVPPPPVPGQNTKHGVVKKCPNCGAVIVPGTTKCSECDLEFSGIAAVSSVQRFADGLAKIEEEGGGNLITGLYGLDKRSRKIISFIRNFPIPNTKEDIVEFILFLKPKASIWSGANDSFSTAAYKTKYKECLAKAKHLFGDDPDVQRLLGIKPKGSGFFGKLF